LSDKPQQTIISSGNEKFKTAKSLLSNENLKLINNESLSLAMPPYGVQVYKLAR